MLSIFSKRIVCPYCLAEIRSPRTVSSCPKCKQEIPIRYASEYDEAPPFFAQVFGWSQVGKTVFLYALTLMLRQMQNVWPRYFPAPANDVTQEKLREISEYLANGKMPPMTQPGPQDVYIMILKNMERWGGRTLVTRDCAGEIFDTMRVPVEQAPYLLNAPTTFMLLSLADMPNSGGRTIDFLMTNYINTLMHNGIDFKREQRKLVVVLTKGDVIPNLPPNLRNYLVTDPLWAAVTANQRTGLRQLDGMAMAEYLETMGRVSDFIFDWIQRDAFGKSFVRLAADKNIDLRFSIISSTGAAVDASGTMPEKLAPRRVLDPYFWALDLQSH